MSVFAYKCVVSMSPEVMYPLESSTYSWDGKSYHVLCTVPGAAVEVDLSYDCPEGLVQVRDPRNCIQVVFSVVSSPCLKWPLRCVVVYVFS